MAGFPDEITKDIFSRLPAEFLVRFRCFLWNPLSNKRIQLPRPRPLVSELIGFGFDPTSSSGHPGDCMVVNVSTDCGFFMGRRSLVEVHCLRENSRKRIGYVSPCGTDRKCLGNQVVFRNFMCRCYQCDAALVLFDRVDEVFRRMTEQICLLEGCLSHRAVVAKNGSTKFRPIQLSPTSGGLLHYSPLGFAGSQGIFFITTSFLGLHPASYKVEVDSVQSRRSVSRMQSLVSLTNTWTTNLFWYTYVLRNWNYFT
ncbi:hypothetical protein ACJRO7_003283 [Eucalyptus globulus]|uniref:F-box domain-containing protein n=1 Tax=Eucalyptus globulus TaxID=34317 RepID=A0ABD3IU73_EUCGL